VTVVNIVAYVTDKQGAAVTNLTRDDFRIFHDGEERPISNFQLYTEELIRSYYQAEEGPPLPPAAEPGTEPGAPPLTEIQPVWVMILVDNDNLQPLDRNRVLGQLRSFVRENTKPPVKMMVASTNRALKIEQEFTDDSTDILGALEGVKMTTGGRTSRDSARTEVYDEIDRFTQSQSSSGRSSLNQARGLAVSFAEEELNGLQFTFGVIREAINLLAGLPGKKMILHLSNGLPMTPGIDLFYALSNAYNEPGMVTEGMRYAQNRQYDSLVKNANAQGVTLYTIGAGSIENVAMGSAEHHAPRDTVAASMEHDNYVDTLRFIAEETGGVAIVNANDIRPRLDRVEQDFYSYYSLGYNLQMSGADNPLPAPFRGEGAGEPRPGQGAHRPRDPARREPDPDPARDRRPGPGLRGPLDGPLQALLPARQHRPAAGGRRLRRPGVTVHRGSRHRGQAVRRRPPGARGAGRRRRL
jgi:VWFA-related protein